MNKQFLYMSISLCSMRSPIIAMDNASQTTKPIMHTRQQITIMHDHLRQRKLPDSITPGDDIRISMSDDYINVRKPNHVCQINLGCGSCVFLTYLHVRMPDFILINKPRNSYDIFLNAIKCCRALMVIVYMPGHIDYNFKEKEV